MELRLAQVARHIGSGSNPIWSIVQAMSALTPISDIGRHACYRCELGASARHKAADLGVAVTVVIGPHNSRTKAVGLGYNRDVRHDKPLPINAYPIVPILSVPVDTEAVGKRTAQALSAREAVEPRLKRRICKSAIVFCGQLDWHQYRRQAKRKDCQTDESAHRGLRRGAACR